MKEQVLEQRGLTLNSAEKKSKLISQQKYIVQGQSPQVWVFEGYKQKGGKLIERWNTPSGSRDYALPKHKAAVICKATPELRKRYLKYAQKDIAVKQTKECSKARNLELD